MQVTRFSSSIYVGRFVVLSCEIDFVLCLLAGSVLHQGHSSRLAATRPQLAQPRTCGLGFADRVVATVGVGRVHVVVAVAVVAHVGLDVDVKVAPALNLKKLSKLVDFHA